MAANIVLADCIVPIDHDYQEKRIYGANICIDCKNACGNCEWSEVDPETEKVKFNPVPGWTAKPATYRVGVGNHARIEHGYRITACPKFEPIEGAKKRKLQVHSGRHGTHKHPVIAISDDGAETLYPSITEAAEATRANRERIRIVCKTGKGKSGGYKWRYADAK